MSLPEFSVVVREHPGGATVKVRGDVDTAAARHLQAALRRVIDGGAQLIVVDLRLAELVRPASLNPIVWGFKEVRSRGGDLILRSPSQETRRLLQATGFAKALRVVDD
jgi:anti-anti-sigma factor